MTNESSTVPRYRQPKFMKDALERIFWTTSYGVVTSVLLSIDSLDLPLWSAPIILAGLNSVKVFVAKQVGNPDSASTLSDV